MSDSLAEVLAAAEAEKSRASERVDRLRRAGKLMSAAEAVESVTVTLEDGGRSVTLPARLLGSEPGRLRVAIIRELRAIAQEILAAEGAEPPMAPEYR